MPIDGDVRRARVALVLVLAATLIGVGAHVATSAAEVEAPTALVESASCGGPPPPQLAPPPAVIAADGSSAAAPITVFIPPTVFIRVDADGAPVAVMTNTGCAPRQSDRVLVEVDATHAIGAPAALTSTVMARTFTGDWRKAGGWREI